MAKEQVSKKERIHRRKRIRRQAIGLVFAFFVVVGIVSILTLGVRYISSFFDDSGDKEEFQLLIAPLVALDPSPFSSIDKANDDTLMEAAIWAALSYEDTTKYNRTPEGLIILPSIDVVKHATRMYGPSYSVNHRSIGSLDMEFTYESGQDAYIVPITSLSSSYTPIVEEITTSGNTKILRVAYAQRSGSSGDIITNPDSQVIAKYMEYVMIKDANGYYIYAVRYPELDETS